MMGRPKYFPDPRMATGDGLLMITPRITTDLLLDAYAHGIFPWSASPAVWYSPDPRAIFCFETLRFPRRLRRLARNIGYRVTFDTCFAEVVRSCGSHHGSASWISQAMLGVYLDFHRQGYAHSVEVWDGDALVGGLYGVQLGAFFAGESMFYRRPDASKLAFMHLVEKLREVGVLLFDSQVLTEHTARLGAFEIPRSQYLSRLEVALADGSGPRAWS